MKSILEKIAAGENRKLEFKSTLPKGKQIAKTAVAFANGAGGDILVGVDDLGTILGLSDDQLHQHPDQLAGMIFDAISPSLVPEIFTSNLDGKVIIVVRIYPGYSKPYFIRSEGCVDGVYIRVGAVNKKVDQEMLRELSRQASNISLDEEPAYDINFETLDLSPLKDAFEKHAERKLDHEALVNLRLIVESQGTVYATNGLLLLLGHRNFSYSRIQCARFKGNSVLEFIDRKEFSGPLHLQIEEAMKFAHNHIPLSGKIEGLYRVDKYEVPLVALREALVNAVVHRDYSISGSDIKFAIFDDRIEITSPGCLPNSLDIDELGKGRSEIRNKVVANAFQADAVH